MEKHNMQPVLVIIIVNMNVISHGNRDWLIGLGKPVMSDEIEYRLMKYVSEYEVDKGYLLVNNITQAMAYIWKSEYMHLFEKGWNTEYMRFLKEHFFLVPLDYNDYEECEKLRKRFLPDLDKSICFTNPSYFTILSTTECNARCFYCYEKGRAQFPMTDEIANKVADFIIKVRDKSKPVQIGWFGGEPTYNTKPMDIISTRLKEAGIPYSASIISNGYLIDEDMCKKFVDLYKINHIQVTIDGIGEKYDRVKNYIYNNDESAFDKVIENIERLLKAGIGVSVRMNLDLHNADSLKQLIHFLRQRLGHYGRLLHPYVYPIFEETAERDPEHRAKVFRQLEEIVFILDECDFMQDAKIHSGLKLQHCMVDSTDSILIGPKGDIGLCEHYTTDHFFSHIDNYEEKDWNEIQAFRDYLEPNELCKDCPLLPSCLRIDLCQDIRYCDEHVRDWRIREASMAARNIVKDYFYNMFKKEEPKQCSCKNKCDKEQDKKNKKTKRKK